MENETMEFNGCKHLDFDDNYTAKKALILLGGTTKVCWDRPVFDESNARLVQFCKLRGRLNCPEACHCEANKMCGDYEEYTHAVTNIKD